MVPQGPQHGRRVTGVPQGLHRGAHQFRADAPSPPLGSNADRVEFPEVRVERVSRRAYAGDPDDGSIDHRYPPTMIGGLQITSPALDQFFGQAAFGQASPEPLIPRLDVHARDLHGIDRLGWTDHY